MTKAGFRSFCSSAAATVKIEYICLESSGPAHDRTFVSAVRVDGKMLGRGEGKSKKLSEQAAARRALEKLSEKDKNNS